MEGPDRIALSLLWQRGTTVRGETDRVMAKKSANLDTLHKSNEEIAIRRFEEALGGRESLVETLISSPELTEDQQRIVGILADPRSDATTLGVLCKKAGILPGQLFKLYRDAAIAKAHIEVIHRTASKIGEVAEDILRRSLPHESPCETCKGIGQLTDEPTKGNPNPSPYPCHACSGRGIQKVDSSLEHQKIALTLVGTLKQGGGGIQVTNQIAAPQTTIHTGGSLVQLQQALQATLFKRPTRVIDADPEEPSNA